MIKIKTRHYIMEHGLYLSWMVAVIAMLGSLYFSEIRGYIPCNLCWYQRILMYPLVVLLGIAAIRKDHKQSEYVLPLAVIGGSISFFHYLMQKTSLFDQMDTTACGIVPCTGEYINLLGFITIPFLALLAFCIIILLQISIIRTIRVR